jgi:hypothetical protein
VLPHTVPMMPGPGLGTLHLRRAGLRKKWVMLLAHGPTDSVLLLHNGKTATVPTGELPPVSQPEIAEPAPALRSPLALLLRYAVAADRGAVTLPWTGTLLCQHAFTILPSMPWHARTTALDVLALGRPDLVAYCGLGPTEATWLGLVHAARHSDWSAVVSAIAALPPNRYRRKIAVIAALLEQLRVVPGAAPLLAPALAAFAPSEPLAVVAQRALGLVAGTARERTDDLALRAGAFALPSELTQLVGVIGASHAEPRAQALLGARGRLAVLHTVAAAGQVLDGSAELADSAELAGGSLAVLDDLIDAGLLQDPTRAGEGRSVTDRTYLTGRIAPEHLTDEQLDQLGHRDEAIRRTLSAGGTELAGDDAELPLGRHVAAVDLVLRRRPQDVELAHVLPAHRDVARQLVAVVRSAESGEEPAALLRESLLADRTTWRPLVTLFGSDRLRGAGQELVRRHSAFFEWLDLVAAREHLFLADWDGAVGAARRCLELATDETVRDEAQNLLACALHNLGDHTGALRELAQAIEGSYSVALLANIGVVATRLDPELAARHLARIVREAPTITMRANAARQALAVWQSDSKIWAGDQNEQRTLPTVLREPLRSMVTEKIDLADFRAVIAALASFDADWLRAPSSLSGSPHRQSIEAKYYVAHARNDTFLSVIDVLATIVDWTTAPEWLLAERDDLVRQTSEFLFEHLDDPANVAAIVAHGLVTKVRGIPAREQVVLALLTVAAFGYHMTNEDKELGDGILDLFRQFEGRVADLDDAARKVVANLTELCVRRITINLFLARKREIDALIDDYNMALRILNQAPHGTAIWFQARRQIAEVAEPCQRSKTQLRLWLRKLEEPDMREAVMDFLENCAELEVKAQNVLRS